MTPFYFWRLAMQTCFSIITMFANIYLILHACFQKDYCERDKAPYEQAMRTIHVCVFIYTGTPAIPGFIWHLSHMFIAGLPGNRSIRNRAVCFNEWGTRNVSFLLAYIYFYPCIGYWRKDAILRLQVYQKKGASRIPQAEHQVLTARILCPKMISSQKQF